MDRRDPVGRVDVNKFVTWGGFPWHRMVQHAVEYLRDLRGTTLLEIGPREGQMMVAFALLGARVTGIDLRDRSGAALSLADAYHVRDRVDYLVGDLSLLPAGAFDRLFTKSVLVTIPDLGEFIEEVTSKLRPGARVTFIENAHGGWFWQKIRRWRRPNLVYLEPTRFREHHLNAIKRSLHVARVYRWPVPPIWLICAENPA